MPIPACPAAGAGVVRQFPVNARLPWPRISTGIAVRAQWRQLAASLRCLRLPATATRTACGHPARTKPQPMSRSRINVIVWNEFQHERENDAVRAIYPDGIHATIAAALQSTPALNPGGAR